MHTLDVRRVLSQTFYLYCRYHILYNHEFALTFLHTCVQVSLQKVAKDVNEMRMRQSWSRQQSASDFYIIRANNDGIQFWSIVMCVLIVVCSLAQVTFVHRLFADPKPSSVSGYNRLRA